MSNQLPAPSDPIAELLHRWLQSKKGRSQSVDTEREYGNVMRRLRADLQANGLDLDSETTKVARYIQAWITTPRRAVKAQMSQSTVKQRMAVISSFYRFAMKQEAIERNPIDRLEYPKVTEYQGARPLERQDVERALSKIPRDIPMGRRDLALLLVAFTTGRRAGELEAMNLGEIALAGDNVIIYWPHTKGGKNAQDTLEPLVGAALLAWLSSWYGVNWPRMAKDMPVWTRIEGDEYQRGKRLSYHGIRQTFIRYLGEDASKVHLSRHSFALWLLQSKKGSIMELKERLGHASLDTTYRYARHLLEGRDTERTQIGGAIGFGEYEAKD